MNFFSQYVKSIISIGFFTFLCEFIYSNLSKGSSVEKAAKFIANLCIFCVIFSPIFSIIKSTNIKSLSLREENSTEISEASFISLTEHELEKSLKAKILSETGIEIEEICTEIFYNADELKIISVSIEVSEKEHEEKVRNYISEILLDNNETKITVEFHDNY